MMVMPFPSQQKLIIEFQRLLCEFWGIFNTKYLQWFIRDATWINSTESRTGGQKTAGNQAETGAKS